MCRLAEFPVLLRDTGFIPAGLFDALREIGLSKAATKKLTDDMRRILHQNMLSFHKEMFKELYKQKDRNALFRQHGMGEDPALGAQRQRSRLEDALDEEGVHVSEVSYSGQQGTGEVGSPGRWETQLASSSLTEEGVEYRDHLGSIVQDSDNRKWDLLTLLTPGMRKKKPRE